MEKNLLHRLTLITIAVFTILEQLGSLEHTKSKIPHAVGEGLIISQNILPGFKRIHLPLVEAYAVSTRLNRIAYVMYNEYIK